MGVLWKLEPATAAKHRLYQRYLDAWWPILLQTSQSTGYSRPRVTLLDAFAGPGRYEDGEPGSPVFILDRLLRHDAVDRMYLSPRRVHLIFIEKDRARHEHLVAELVSRFGPLKDLPVRADAAAAWGARPGHTMIKMTMTVTACHQGHDGTSNSRAALSRRTGMSAPFGTSNGLCTHSRWLPVGAYT